MKPITTFATILGLTAAIAITPALAQEAAKPAETPPAAAAEEEEDWIPGEISGSVALTTDYIFRGISQTDHNAAAQAGLNYSVETGLLGTSVYTGFWGSNVDFNDGDEANAEIDVLFGVTGDVGETGLAWNLGGIYYWYPGADGSLDYNYWEVNPGLSYAPFDWLNTSLQYFYSPDFFAGSGNAHYVSGGIKIPFPIKYVGLTFDASTGHQWIEDGGTFGLNGTSSYQDWKIGFTLNVKGVDLGIAYTDTNLTKRECYGGTNLCEARGTFTLGYAF
jgi:uncharacterized protein (TIGR02001 family)